MDADFADYTDLLAGLGALGLARLDVNIRQSQNLRPQAISTNGRQKLCKPAATAWSHTKGLSTGFLLRDPPSHEASEDGGQS